MEVIRGGEASLKDCAALYIEMEMRSGWEWEDPISRSRLFESF
jgi:hypothetical protein